MYWIITKRNAYGAGIVTSFVNKDNEWALFKEHPHPRERLRWRNKEVVIGIAQMTVAPKTNPDEVIEVWGCDEMGNMAKLEAAYPGSLR